MMMMCVCLCLGVCVIEYNDDDMNADVFVVMFCVFGN
jgi:hypothetical protein